MSKKSATISSGLEAGLAGGEVRSGGGAAAQSGGGLLASVTQPGGGQTASLFASATGKTLPPFDGGYVIISGGEKADELRASLLGVKEILLGESGNDELHGAAQGTGAAGYDSLYGGAGDDRLYGGAGKSGDEAKGEVLLDGGAGDDLLVGNHTLLGGLGRDTLAVSDGTTTGNYDAWAYGGSGQDLITGSGSRLFLNGGSGNDQIVLQVDAAAFNESEVVGWNGDDVLRAVRAEAWSGQIDNIDLRGFDGSDTIEVTNVAASAWGGGEDDTIYAAGADQYLYGEYGDDRIFAGSGNHRIDAGFDGSDLFQIDGFDLLYGGSGNDILTGAARDTTMFGGAGNDEFKMRISGWDVSSDDWIDGGEGDDLISNLGTGFDTYIGGAGADTFRVADLGAFDSVMDFDRAEGDVVDVRAIITNSVTDPIAEGYVRATEHTGPQGTYVQVSVDRDGGGNSYSAAYTLYNTSLAQLTGTEWLRYD